MNSFFGFIKNALSDGLDDTPSTRRLVLSWFAFLGGIALCFGLGFATALLFGFNQADRLDYFKETLDWVYWLFATGCGFAGLTYGATEIMKARPGRGGKDETKPTE